MARHETFFDEFAEIELSVNEKIRKPPREKKNEKNCWCKICLEISFIDLGVLVAPRGTTASATLGTGRTFLHDDVLGFVSFLPLLYDELDFVTFIQRAERITFNLDRRKVHENIFLLAIRDYKAISLASIKPFHCT